MGVCTRYPKAFCRKESKTSLDNYGDLFSVWDGNNGFLGMGVTEGDAWEDARQNIIKREGSCP